jgi:IS30 family transposase
MNRAPVDHTRIAELAKEGLTVRQIAEIVGCHYNTVHHSLNPKAYDRHLDRNIADRARKRGEPPDEPA